MLLHALNVTVKIKRKRATERKGANDELFENNPKTKSARKSQSHFYFFFLVFFKFVFVFDTILFS